MLLQNIYRYYKFELADKLYEKFNKLTNTPKKEM